MEQDDGIGLFKVAKGHNPTFGPGKDWFLNACVGTNTGANPWEGYRGGFQAGAEVLLAAAGVSRPEGASESWGMPNVDYLVYPVCLCARHHVELSLKLAIPVAWNIFKRRNPNSNKGLQEPPEQDERHGLLPIWGTLDEISGKVDQRLAKAVSGLEELIQDFNKVDPTGQVFRYATGLDSEPHLEDITHINLQTFANRYAKLCRELEALHILLSFLSEEYATGSFTVDLNREQLTEIAESLPDRANWDSEEFDQVKKDLIQRYGLTSRGFQRALRKIQETRSLAVKIGVVEPLTTITAETFEKIMSASEGVFRTDPGFSAEECAAISALLQISGLEYPEYFAWYSRPLSEEADEDRAASLENEREWSSLARKVCQRPDRLLRGLLLLGQAELGTQLQQILNVKFEALERAQENGKKSSRSFFAKGKPKRLQGKRETMRDGSPSVYCPEGLLKLAILTDILDGRCSTLSGPSRLSVPGDRSHEIDSNHIARVNCQWTQVWTATDVPDNCVAPPTHLGSLLPLWTRSQKRIAKAPAHR